MATLSDTWSREAVYAAFGFKRDADYVSRCASVIPRGFGATITYAGLQVTCETTRDKTNKLYRIFVTCTCGKKVAFCKMPQHLGGKRHDGDRDTFTLLTPQAMAIDARHLASIRESGRWSDDDIRSRPYWSHLAYLL